MGNDIILRLNDISNDQEEEVKEFLDKKEIKYDRFDSAYEAWNNEEAGYILEFELSEGYNTDNINIHDFIEKNKDELANIFINTDVLLNDMNYSEAEDYTKEFLKNKGIKTIYTKE